MQVAMLFCYAGLFAGATALAERWVRRSHPELSGRERSFVLLTFVAVAALATHVALSFFRSDVE